MQKTSPEAIVEKAVGLFRKQGYRATSMKDIGDACGLLKGSLYYHFKSKDEILFAAVDMVESHFQDAIYAASRDESLSEKERLEQILDRTEDYFLEHRACIIAHLAVEAIVEVPDFQDRIQAFLTRWADALVRVLTPHYGADQAKAHAQDIITGVEGSVLWLSVFGDKAPLLRVTARARDLLP